LKKINIDIIRQSVPMFFYKRIKWAKNELTTYLIIPIDIGYTYLLRSIRTKWNSHLRLDSPPHLAVRMNAGFVQQHANRELQNLRYDQSLISSPGTDGKVTNGTGILQQGVQVITETNPVDLKNFGVNFSATPVQNNVILNHFYQRKESLDLRLEFSAYPTREGSFFGDILLEGYYIPDNYLEQWK